MFVHASANLSRGLANVLLVASRALNCIYTVIALAVRVDSSSP